MSTPTPSATYRRVFISHAHADNAICARFAAALRARGIDVWLDLDDAQKGHALSEDIERQLDARSAFVLMVTESSNSSHWVALELGNYIALWADKPTHLLDGLERLILPVRLEAVPVPGRVRNFNWLDAVAQPFEQTVDQIARALAVASNHPQPATPPAPPVAPPLPGEPAPTPARLAALGFAARRVNGVEVILPPLCDVPAGDFLMGSDPQQDKAAQDSEQPQYLIPLPYPFQIARFPITVAEYACFVRSGHVAPPKGSWRPITWEDQLKHLDHPVVCITWHDATAYAAWLAKTTRRPWRLPSEAEWEKATRWNSAMRQSHIYPWGDAFDKARCNTSASGIGATTPIGSYPSGASPCGALDMSGNVWEWTSTVFKPYPYNASDGRERADSIENRVLRGGSWGVDPALSRAAFRLGRDPTVAGGNVGFRVVVARAAPGS
ncbi:MAG TPA: SUMF1/EgtB/PvdO family nonheme iron enzyme [Ktedonobacterales bacterium]